jgi:hypothetical protein
MDSVISYAIFDVERNRPYFGNKSWPNKRAAQLELNYLLKPYAKDSIWRKRLRIRSIAGFLEPPTKSINDGRVNNKGNKKPRERHDKPKQHNYQTTIRMAFF